MKISVTAADIAEGQRMQCHRCPVALAVARAFKLKNPDDVAVAYSDIRIRTRSYSLPSAASKFIDRFDQGLKGRPFDFYLEVQ